MNTRNVRIDIIKGIGISLIVLGHTQMFLSQFVNLFHVGLFFIASGYCFKEKNSDDLSGVGRFFVKRVKQLYVPFVLWNLGYLCLHNLLCEINIYSLNSELGSMYPLIGRYSVSDTVRQAVQIVLVNAGEQLAGACWFLRALFVMDILFVFSDFLIKKITPVHYNKIRIAVAVLMLGMGSFFSSRDLILHTTSRQSVPAGSFLLQGSF